MKKYFVLFMAVILSAFVLAGCGSDENAEAVAELQATINDLQSQIQEYTALESELETANNSIAELQSQFDALQAEKDEMTAKLEMLYKIEPLDVTMYTTADAEVYDDLYGEVLGYEPVATIPEGTEVKITGKSAVIDWYVIKTEDGSIQMVSGGLVSETKPVQQTTPSSGGNGSSGNGGGTTQQPSGGGNQQPSGGGNGGSQPPADDGGGFDAGSIGLPEIGGGGLQDGGGGSWFGE